MAKSEEKELYDYEDFQNNLSASIDMALRNDIPEEFIMFSLMAHHTILMNRYIKNNPTTENDSMDE